MAGTHHSWEGLAAQHSSSLYIFMLLVILSLKNSVFMIDVISLSSVYETREVSSFSSMLPFLR